MLYFTVGQYKLTKILTLRLDYVLLLWVSNVVSTVSTPVLRLLQYCFQIEFKRLFAWVNTTKYLRALVNDKLSDIHPKPLRLLYLNHFHRDASQL